MFMCIYLLNRKITIYSDYKEPNIHLPNDILGFRYSVGKKIILVKVLHDNLDIFQSVRKGYGANQGL